MLYRFFEPAVQAVKCCLRGIYPTSSKDADGRWKRDKFPLQLLQMMPKYNGKDAVAFFDHWIASGHPGNIASNPGFFHDEPLAFAV